MKQQQLLPLLVAVGTYASSNEHVDKNQVAKLMSVIEPGLSAREWRTQLFPEGGQPTPVHGFLYKQLRLLNESLYSTDADDTTESWTEGILPQLKFPDGIERVLFDVGTHGFSTFLGLPALDHELMAIGFEPQVSIASQHPTHERFLMLPFALSDAPGVMELNTFSTADHEESGAPETQGASLLAHTKAFEDGTKGRQGGHYKVLAPVITIDSFARLIPRSIELTYIKVDAQGADQMVISGGRKTVEERVALGVSLECQDLPSRDDDRLYYEGSCLVSELKPRMASMGMTESICEINNLDLREGNCHFARTLNRVKLVQQTHGEEIQLPGLGYSMSNPVKLQEAGLELQHPQKPARRGSGRLFKRRARGAKPTAIMPGDA